MTITTLFPLLKSPISSGKTSQAASLQPPFSHCLPASQTSEHNAIPPIASCPGTHRSWHFWHQMLWLPMILEPLTSHIIVQHHNHLAKSPDVRTEGLTRTTHSHPSPEEGGKVGTGRLFPGRGGGKLWFFVSDQGKLEISSLKLPIFWTFCSKRRSWPRSLATARTSLISLPWVDGSLEGLEVGFVLKLPQAFYIVWYLMGFCLSSNYYFKKVCKKVMWWHTRLPSNTIFR